MEDVSFQREIRRLEARRERELADLENLKTELKKFQEKTERCRNHLRRLRTLARGQLPERPDSGRPTDIERVETDPESGHPPQGARRRQIRSICEAIGADAESFRTREVLDRLGEIEEELTDGMETYAYSVMDDLAEEGVVEKVGWGEWRLQR